jgi:hypothetical protein
MEFTTTEGAEMYNATAYTLKDDGSILSTSIVELDDNGLVIRAAG